MYVVTVNHINLKSFSTIFMGNVKYEPGSYMHTYIYRRTGFKCEHVITANSDFSPSVQLLERNV